MGESFWKPSFLGSILNLGSVYRITSLQQLLLTHPTRLSHSLVHPSFPLQDSFAKCFPSRYGLYSVTASSTHGDTWSEKSSPSDEPDPEKTAGIRVRIKDILWRVPEIAKEVDSQQGTLIRNKGSWYMKILDYEKKSPWRFIQGDGVLNRVQKKKLSQEKMFQQCLPQIEKCQAGSLRVSQTTKQQNPPTLWSSEPRPSCNERVGRTNESQGFFLRLKLRGG